MSTFSIIVPVYNVEKFLRECLDSILAQTFADWECICVDDGSTDSSGAILDEYATNDARFRVLHQVNAGVGAARNAGLEIASSEWIWFIDADDTIHPGSLSFLKKTGAQFSWANTIRIGFVKGDFSPSQWPIQADNGLSLWEQPSDGGLRRFFYGMCLYVMRRNAIADLRFHSFPRGEDSLFLYEYAVRGFGLVDASHLQLYFYRQWEGSATHTVVNAAVVELALECQRQQILQFCKTIGILGISSSPLCWNDLFRSCYQTYYRMYFRLPARDRSTMLPAWLKNLDLFIGRFRPPLETRIRILLIRATRSGLLVRRLALGWIPGLNSSVRVLRTIRQAVLFGRMSPKERR